MSGSFAFSASAKPFYPKVLNRGGEAAMQEKIDSLQAEVEKERLSNMKLMKLYKGQCSSVQEKNEIRLKELTQENERLNREIRRVNTSLLEERMDKRGLEEIIGQKQNAIQNLKENLTYKDDKYNTLQRRYDELNREFSRYKESNDPEEWMGRCLKLDFIFKKIKQIGALPEDHGAWVWDMVEDIEFPDDTSISVFLNVPISVRNRYLPSTADAVINFQEDENLIIEELSREAENFNANLSENFRRNLDENPELVMNSIRIIQSRFRDHIRIPSLEKRIASATKIQSVWRGFCGRGIKTYKGKFYQLVNECKIALDIPLSPEEIKLSPDRDKLPIRISFANTSNQPIWYQWIKINNTEELEGTKGNAYIVLPGNRISVKVFTGHWFRIYKRGNEQDTFIHINPASFLGSLRTDEITSHPVVFDLNTKITLPYTDFRQWEEYNISGILNTQYLCNERHAVNSINIQDEEGNDDEDDDARLMLAIQLSLEQTSSLTSDAIDFNIDNLYQ